MKPHQKEIIKRLAQKYNKKEYVVEEIVKQAEIFLKLCIESGHCWTLSLPGFGKFTLWGKHKLQMWINPVVPTHKLFIHVKPLENGMVRVYDGGRYDFASLEEIIQHKKRGSFIKNPQVYELTAEEFEEKYKDILMVYHYVPGQYFDETGFDRLSFMKTKWQDKI